MPHYRRVYIPGSWYFFTVVTFERRPILTTPSSPKSLQTAIDTTRTRYPFTTVAWVLLPNHLHCIWQLPERDADFSTRWRLIKTYFTREYLRGSGVTHQEVTPSRARHGEKAVWQRRFWEHCIRDDEDLRRHINYIHYNPVKHGLVTEALDWRLSSIHRSEYREMFDRRGLDVEKISVMEPE